MRFDLIAFLGGLTAGAAGAALFHAISSKRLLGQGVVTGGDFGSGDGRSSDSFFGVNKDNEAAFIRRRRYPVQAVAWGL